MRKITALRTVSLQHGVLLLCRGCQSPAAGHPAGHILWVWGDVRCTQSTTTHRCSAVTFIQEGGLGDALVLEVLRLRAHPRGLWAAWSWGRGHLLLVEADTSVKDMVLQHEETLCPWPCPLAESLTVPPVGASRSWVAAARRRGQSRFPFLLSLLPPPADLSVSPAGGTRSPSHAPAAAPMQG